MMYNRQKIMWRDNNGCIITINELFFKCNYVHDFNLLRDYEEKSVNKNLL